MILFTFQHDLFTPGFIEMRVNDTLNDRRFKVDTNQDNCAYAQNYAIKQALHKALNNTVNQKMACFITPAEQADYQKLINFLNADFQQFPIMLYLEAIQNTYLPSISLFCVKNGIITTKNTPQIALKIERTVNHILENKETYFFEKELKNTPLNSQKTTSENDLNNQNFNILTKSVTS